MKSLPCLILALATSAQAAERTKASNSNALNTSEAWNAGLIPTSADTAVWDAPYDRNPSTASAIGASQAWLGIRIAAPNSDPRIRNTTGATLTLGTGGINMAAATRDFSILPPVILASSQSWNLAEGRLLSVTEINGTAATILTKSGPGTLALTGTLAFPGPIALTAGTLRSANSSGTQALTGPITGPGTLEKISAGDLTLAVPNPAFSGTIALTSGRLNLNHPGTLGTATLVITGGSVGNTSGAPITLAAGSTQQWNGDWTFSGPHNLTLGGSQIGLTPNRTLTIAEASLNLQSTLTSSGSLTKAGPGTLQLSAPGELVLDSSLIVTGGTFSLAGGELRCDTLQIGNGGTVDLTSGKILTRSISRTAATATLRFAGATLTATGANNAFISGLDAALIASSPAILDIDGWPITLPQPLAKDPALGTSPDGGLRLSDSFGSGTLTLTGANTYTGPTVIQSGTLALGPGGSIAQSPLIEIDADATFDAGTATTLPSGQTLQGTGTVTGNLTVGPGATLSPAGTTIGTLRVNDHLTLQGNTAIQIHKAGTLLTSDRITNLLRLTYGGTLAITATGNALANGNRFEIFDALDRRGAFSQLNLPALPAGLYWETANLTTDGSIQVINTLPRPTLNPPAGAYIGAQTVTISGLNNSTIHYTTDGSDPLTSPTRTSTPSPATGIAIPLGSTNFQIRAYTTLPGAPASLSFTASYDILNRGTWTDTASGDWSDASKWDRSAIPAGVSILADFTTLTLNGPITVTVDSSRTLGALRVGDQGALHNWTVNPANNAVITLDNGAEKPVIHVENGTTTLATPLFGTGGYLKTGQGTLITPTANPSLTGGVVVAAGDVRIDKVNSLGPATIILGDASTGSDEARILQAGSNPWPPTDTWCENPITVAAGPTGRLVIARANQGNYAALFRGTITLNNNVILRHEGGDRMGIEGKITGIGNVTLEGTRINVDNNANDFVGDLIISPGTLMQINGNGVIPATTDVTANGTIGFNTGSANSLTFGALNGSGRINVSYGGGAASISIGSGDRSGNFSGIITNLITVNKIGTGKQILSGIHTYGAPTNVNGGTLVNNGALPAASAVTVANTATLAGSGSAPGNVIVTPGATLSPGDNSTATLATGPLTLNGTYACSLDAAAADRVAVTGNLILTGASLAIHTLAPPTPGTRTILTFTGTRTGTFANVPPGYTVDYSTPNEIKLTVQSSSSGYSSWIAGFGLTGNAALADADPDRDDIPNAIEFVLGGNPATRMDAALLPTIDLVTNPGGPVVPGQYLRFTYRRTQSSAYLNPGMETNTRLQGAWTPATGTPGAVQVTTPDFYTTPTLADRVEVFVPRSAGSLFGRLKVVP